jgi:hypothetical protein
MGSGNVCKVQGGFAASRTRGPFEEVEDIIALAVVLFVSAALFPAEIRVDYRRRDQALHANRNVDFPAVLGC